MKLRSAEVRRGITLLEVIVALAIFLFSIVAISQLVSIGSERALDVQFHAKASMLCQSKLAELTVGVEPLTSASSSLFKEEPEWLFEIDAVDGDITGLKKVTVTVRQERPDGRVIEVALSQVIFDPTLRGSTLDAPAPALGSATTPSTPGGMKP